MTTYRRRRRHEGVREGANARRLKTPVTSLPGTSVLARFARDAASPFMQQEQVATIYW